MARGDVRTAIILAGGRSTRMGTDKSEVVLGGQTLLDRAVEKMGEMFDEVVVVTNRPDVAYENAVVVHDRTPYQGPLGGILAGLEASSSFYNFVVACDMPFVNPKVVQLMTSVANFDVVMPRTDRGAEPLFAIYAKTCIPVIVEYLTRGDLRIVSFLDEVRVKYINSERIRRVDPQMQSFFNINTQQDLRQAEEHLGIRRPSSAGIEAGLVKRRRITHISKEGVEQIEKGSPPETAVTLYLNKEELITIQATPGHLDDLAVGFLFSEGVLTKRSDLKSVLVDSKRGMVWVDTPKKADFDVVAARRYVTSGCGRGLTFTSVGDARGMKRVESDVSIKASEVTALVRQMGQESVLYHEVGGVHCAALARGPELLWVREDIGRHNAVDKVLGRAVRESTDLANAVLVVTGRISYEMVIKVAKAGVPVVVSRSAPTDLAVELGEALGLTIVGYARGEKMNVYCGVERIVPDIEEQAAESADREPGEAKEATGVEPGEATAAEPHEPKEVARVEPREAREKAGVEPREAKEVADDIS